MVLYRFTARHAVVMDPADGRLHRLSHARFREQWTGVLVLLVPGEAFRPGTRRAARSGASGDLVRPHRGVMSQALVGAIAYTLLGLSSAVYVQKMVDHVIPGGNRGCSTS